MKPCTPPERGDLVEVSYITTLESPAGDPDTATPARRKSYGLFWDRRVVEGVEVLVTTTTQDDDEVKEQSGFCCYPAAIVTRVVVVRRRRHCQMRRGNAA